jgi:hypothetical protein
MLTIHLEKVGYIITGPREFDIEGGRPADRARAPTRPMMPHGTCSKQRR